jgi:putative ABC transport system ATP-binding protein
VSVLVARGLRWAYGTARSQERTTVIDDVDLELQAGELCVLAGPSGSGKTTLLNLLTGFQVPDRGELRLARASEPAGGLVDEPLGVPSWRQLAVVPQSLGLLDEICLFDNVSLPRRLAGELDDDARADIDALLVKLSLTHVAHRLPHEASLGEQQRAAIARAVTITPSVLVVDEPTSHQDAANRDRVVGALWAAAGSGSAVVAATHDPQIMDAADRLFRIEGGRLFEERRRAS